MSNRSAADELQEFRKALDNSKSDVDWDAHLRHPGESNSSVGMILDPMNADSRVRYLTEQTEESISPIGIQNLMERVEYPADLPATGLNLEVTSYEESGGEVELVVGREFRQGVNYSESFRVDVGDDYVESSE